MRLKSIYNNQLLKQRRGELRKNQTEAEKILWSCIRNKLIAKFKFFRQYSVGVYILDFYCPRARLAIELDGDRHKNEDNRAYDHVRDLYLEGHDICTLRFWNDEILKDLDSALEVIKKNLTRSPLKVRGGRGEL